MKKINCINVRELRFSNTLKILMIMKLTIFLILFSVLGSIASDTYSQSKKLTFELKQATIKDILVEIEEQSEFYFLYSEKVIDVDRIVSVQVENKKIESVLNTLFEGTEVAYVIKDRIIVLSSAADLIDDTANTVFQQATIKGQVVDSEGLPLPGVTVIVKGTTQGTVTNADGNYSISNIPDNATLVFSFIGMRTQEVVVGNQTTINIVTEEATIGIEEVVAVAYGTQTKRSVTGSIQSVSADEMADIPVSSATQTLQGKLAGVQINQTTGRPGKGSFVRIRGAGSISAGSNPLYVVDGFPIDGDLTDINIDEIASVSVLKDAASTSLYGSRAANGVVLITTKSADVGATNVNFRAYYGVQEIPERGRPDMMNGTEFARFKKESYEDKGLEVPIAFQNPEQYGKGYDWYDIMFKPAPIQNYNISLTSRTKKFSASAIVGYMNQDGVMINSGYKRFSLRVNTEYNVNDKITIGFNAAPTSNNSFSAGTDGNFYDNNLLYLGLLNWPIIDRDGNIGNTGYTINDLSALGGFPQGNYYKAAQEIENTSSSMNLLTNGYIEIEPIDGLKLKQSINVQYRTGDSKYFNPSTVSTRFATPVPMLAFANYGTNKSVNWMSETSANYTKSWNDSHNLEVLGVYSTQEAKRQTLDVAVENFPDDRISDVDAAVTLLEDGTDSGFNEWSLISYVGRINYNYKSRYFFTLSARRDGSSRFGKNNLWGTFPSASAAWILSDESFYNQNSTLNYVKLRGSYGITGNNNIGNYSQYAAVRLGENAIWGSTVASGSQVSNMANASLNWEKSSQLDLGFDLGFFNNRVYLNYDYYSKKTYDMLYNFSIPASSGFHNFLNNTGELKFWGHEIAVTSKNTVGEFKWTTNLNITFSDNEVVSLTNDVDAIYGGGHITKVGERIGLFWGLVNDGVYLDEEDLANSPKESRSDIGTVKFKDMGGPNGTGPDGEINNTDTDGDRVVIGDPTPKFLFGMTNNFRYKNFDLSIVMSGSVGNDIANRFYQGVCNLDGPFNVLKEVKDRWRSVDNPGKGYFPTTQYNTNRLRDWFHSGFIENGSFLTIKNVTLGYSINVSKVSFLSELRVYGSVQQLYTFTNYSGNNPEISNNTSILQLGDDIAGYPVPRTCTFGVNVGF